VAQFPATGLTPPDCPLVRCEACGLVFQDGKVNAALLEEQQRQTYGAPTKRFGALVEVFIHGFRTARVRTVQRLVPTGGRVLDVGCGRGLFLRLLMTRGYEVRGTELSDASGCPARRMLSR
jgi:SAM-dependent methyltransferase